MINTTFAKAKEARACIRSYRKMAKALGGIEEYGKDTPIPLLKVLETCGLQDAIWCLQCTLESSENILIEFACRCAEHVLYIFENAYPNDSRPRQAIEAARICITNKTKAAGVAVYATKAAVAGVYATKAAEAAVYAARAAVYAAVAAVDAAGAAVDATKAAEAAVYAAGAAAYATKAAVAGGAAEREWQRKHFIELLTICK